ncbi:MAG: hypothetical protein GX640_19435 [Fibrobacter sp.]|nr:hypothetical protein [Fibrobacter sp.]
MSTQSDLLKTPEVANVCGCTVNTVLKYARELSIIDDLIRNRRGDYYFTTEQVGKIKNYVWSFEKN